jgi:hypothetical protein
MAKGDILEPLLEGAIRIFFPSRNLDKIIEILSWPWLASLVAFLLIHYSMRKSIDELSAESEEEKSLKSQFAMCRYAAVFGILLSLAMFRFGNSF